MKITPIMFQYHELDYASVMEKLGVTSHTQLEDVFIAANAAGYITGKMDQERQRFYINTSGFLKICQFLEQILTEHKEPICSLDSKL